MRNPSVFGTTTERRTDCYRVPLARRLRSSRRSVAVAAGFEGVYPIRFLESPVLSARSIMALTKSGSPVDIKPARGKLGILTPGHGRGRHHVHGGRRGHPTGIAKPIGSLTQMGTIRLGKRTENRSPLIKEFVPLAKLEDIVFGGWDLFPDDAYQAAAKAGVLSSEHLAAVKPFLSDIKPMTAGVRSGLREEADRHPLQDRQVQDGPGRAGDRGHRELPEDQQLRPPGDGVVRVDRGVPRAGPGARQRGGVREGPARERSRDRPVADLRLRRAEVRGAVRQRRPQPDGRHPGPAGAGPGEVRSPWRARTSRPARRS